MANPWEKGYTVDTGTAETSETKNPWDKGYSVAPSETKAAEDTVTHKLATQADTLASDVTAITHNTQSDIPQDVPAGYVGTPHVPERSTASDVALGAVRGINDVGSFAVNQLKNAGAVVGGQLGLTDGTYVPIDINKQGQLPETQTGAGYATEKTIPFVLGGEASKPIKLAEALPSVVENIPLVGTTLKLALNNAIPSAVGAGAENPTDTTDFGKHFWQNEAFGIAGEAAFRGMLPTFAKMGANKHVSDNINKIDQADAKITQSVEEARNAPDEATAQAASQKWQEGIREKNEALTKVGVSQDHIEQAHTELSVYNDLNNNGYKGGAGMAIKHSQIPNAKEVYGKLNVGKTKTAWAMSKMEKVPGFRDPNLKANRIEAVNKTAETNADTLSTLPEHDLTDALKDANTDIAAGKYQQASQKLDAIKTAWTDHGIQDGFTVDTGVDAKAFSKQLLYTDTLARAGQIARGTKRVGSPVVDWLAKWGPTIGGATSAVMHATGTGLHIPGGYASSVGIPAAMWAGKKALNSTLSGNVARGLEENVAVTGGDYSPSARQVVAANVAEHPQAVLQGGYAAATAPEPEQGPIYPTVQVGGNQSSSSKNPWEKGYTLEGSSSQSVTPPDETRNDDNPVGTILYNAFRVPETGGLKDPYIRTKADSAAGPSSAIGPVQITGTRVNDFITRHADKLTPEELAFAKDWVEYARLTLHAPKGSGGGHGEAGILADPHSKVLYDSIAKKMLYQTYLENGQDIHKTVYSWTGPHAWTQHYENAVISNIKPIGA